MSGRHREPVRRTVADRRATHKRLAGAGAAGVAAVFSVAPFAHADTVPPAPTSSSAGQPDGGAAPATSPPATSPAATTSAAGPAATSKAPVHRAAPAAQATTTTAAAAPTPNYGLQKFRVGVRIRAGAAVPAGTTTVGTDVTITETGPNAPTPNTSDCVTVGPPDTDTATYCPFNQQALAAQVSRISDVTGMSAASLRARAAGLANAGYYVALPGDTVTLTQKTVQPNLVIDPTVRTVGPCEATSDQLPICAPTPDVVFDDDGLPPAARNDSTSTEANGQVVIDVLKNDTTDGIPATVSIVSQPAHGTAAVKTVPATGTAARTLKAAATKQVLTYTPQKGFAGTDSFTYRLTNANGSSVARVTIKVLAPPPTAKDDTASTTSGTAISIDVLANDDANGGGALRVQSVGDPAHGTATIVNGEIRYTPSDGFTGTDTFTYVAAASGGTDTATVTVNVTGSGVANTGSSNDGLVELAALLIGAGGAATIAGRRRYRARHVGSA